MKSIIEMKDLSDSREVMMQKSPLSVSVFIYILLAALVTALLWAAFGKIDTYVSAAGEIRPDDAVATVSSINGGKIKAIHALDGETVHVGDLLIEFDAASTAEQKELLDTQLASAKEKLGYYETLKQSVELGENLFSLTTREELFYYQYENYVLSVQNQVEQINVSNDQTDSKRRELNHSITSAQAQIDDARASAESYRGLYDAVAANEAYTGTNAQMMLLYLDYKTNYDTYYLVYKNAKETYDKLVEQTGADDGGDSSAAVSQDSVDQAKYAMDSAANDVFAVRNKFLLELNTSIEELQANISTLETQKKTYTLQLDALSKESLAAEAEEKAKAEFFVTINNSIAGIQSEIDTLQNQLITANQSSENASILAQRTGTLVLTQEMTEGDFLASGAQIGTIVPDGGQLKVLLYIPEGRISEIKVGQEIEYTIGAISVTDYGKIRGNISSVSADSFVDEGSGQKFYKAEALLDSTTLQNKSGESIRVQTGMLLEGRVISGSQSILSWLLDKLNLRE